MTTRVWYVMILTKTNTPVVKKGKATELSQKVADVLVSLRQSRQMSQRAFADHIGVSFQQYQKYEKGRDRLSLEKAMLLCAELDLPLGVFMEDSGPVPGFAESEQAGFSSRPSAPMKAPASRSEEEEEILAIFAKVPKKSKHDFLETVRQLAKMTSVKS